MNENLSVPKDDAAGQADHGNKCAQSVVLNDTKSIEQTKVINTIKTAIVYLDPEYLEEVQREMLTEAEALKPIRPNRSNVAYLHAEMLTRMITLAETIEKIKRHKPQVENTSHIDIFYMP